MKKIIRLPFIDILASRLKSESQFIQVLLGPRQVGKTTSVLHYLENEYHGRYKFFSADAIFISSTNWIEEIWQEAKIGSDLIVIDEIQKIENWSEVIKKLWDETKLSNKKISCLLLGSSSLELQRGLSESLTGRFQLIRAHHWNFKESQQLVKLNFQDYLKFGGYPASYSLIKNQDEFYHYLSQSIVTTVIEKDILKNHSVKSPSLFKQAFELIMSYPAQEISYTKLLGQLQDKGNTDLIKHYISLYEGAYLVKSLHKFSGSLLIKRTSSPKLIPLCPAFYSLQVQQEYSTSEQGRVFELTVGMALVRIFTDLFYWREGNYEVDYIAKKGKQIYAIEVKSGRRKSTQGLTKFCEHYPNAKKIFITLDNYQQFEQLGIDFFTKDYGT
jgi:predicted AAA+ superfamily ATPase